MVPRDGQERRESWVGRDFDFTKLSSRKLGKPSNLRSQRLQRLSYERTAATTAESINRPDSDWSRVFTESALIASIDLNRNALPITEGNTSMVCKLFNKEGQPAAIFKSYDKIHDKNHTIFKNADFTLNSRINALNEVPMNSTNAHLFLREFLKRSTSKFLFHWFVMIIRQRAWFWSIMRKRTQGWKRIGQWTLFVEVYRSSCLMLKAVKLWTESLFYGRCASHWSPWLANS